MDVEAESRAAGLQVDGVSVQDRFLTTAELRALNECARVRRERGDFDAARIGSTRNLQRRSDIRGDSTCWLTPPLLPAEQELLCKLEQVRLELNRDALLGLFDLELHYAWYPPGAAYARHVDQPHGRTQRQVSLVLYLNEAWTPAAGGELRIFDGRRDLEDSAAMDSAAMDIAPIGGRLVCFLTPGREHAVLETTCERLSISGWFRARE